MTAPDPNPLLASLESLKRYLQISGGEHDGLLLSLLEAVSAQFRSHTGRELTARAYSPDPADPAFDPDNAVLDGNGYPDLLLPQYPVFELTSLLVDGQALPPAPPGGQANGGYLLDRAAGMLSLAQGVFPRGRANVAVSYCAGFATIPADLAQAAVEQAATRFQESAAGQGRLGVSARTLADGSLSYATGPLLPQVAAVLERYRSRSLL
jgi:hypothetical protein